MDFQAIRALAHEDMQAVDREIQARLAAGHPELLGDAEAAAGVDGQQARDSPRDVFAGLGGEAGGEGGGGPGGPRALRGRHAARAAGDQEQSGEQTACTISLATSSRPTTQARAA